MSKQDILLSPNRKSTLSFSFPRDSRFKYRQHSLDIPYSQMPSTLNKRFTKMGFGSRWTPKNAKGLDSPPPGHYTLPSTLQSSGPKFNRKSSFRIPENLKFSTPGPGSYRSPSSLGGPQYSIKGNKIKIRFPNSPAPGLYYPKIDLTVHKPFNKISFGFGKRSSLDTGPSRSPGPGCYNPKSTFDKFKAK